jgi:DNA-binding MarR family transcriptional regulator
MGYNEMDKVWDKSQATKTDKLVLLAIARRYKRGVGAWPSQSHLAKICGVDKRSISNSIKRLEALGELTWVRGSNLSKKANLYFITAIEGAKTSTDFEQKLPVKTAKTSTETDKNFHLLNKELNNLLNAEEVVFDSRFASPLMKKSVDRVAGVLSPLQVSDLLETFANSYDCTSAYTDEIRVSRWYAQLDKAASQAEREVR